MEFNETEYDEINTYCKKKKINWLASAWDLDSLKFLDKYECNYQKVASAMITSENFLEEVASRQKYTFISTGMSNVDDIEKAVKDIKTGLVEIRNDKDGNLASTIGRKSFSSEKLLDNYNHFIESVKKEKPETIKGEFIKNTFITSSMGISYKVGAK